MGDPYRAAIDQYNVEVEAEIAALENDSPDQSTLKVTRRTPPIRCIDPDCETRTHWLRPHSCKESKEPGFYESPLPMKPEFQTLIARGNVTRKETAELRGNSWDWLALMPVLDSDAFMNQLEYCLRNCNRASSRPAAVYDEAVLHEWLPELIARFKRLESLMSHDIEAMVTYEKE